MSDSLEIIEAFCMSSYKVFKTQFDQWTGSVGKDLGTKSEVCQLEFSPWNPRGDQLLQTVAWSSHMHELLPQINKREQKWKAPLYLTFIYTSICATTFQMLSNHKGLMPSVLEITVPGKGILILHPYLSHVC